MWDKLEIMYEGTNQIKEIRINMLVHGYVIFKMEEGERVKQMFERLFVIINDLHALGRIISKNQLIIKNLRTLPRA